MGEAALGVQPEAAAGGHLLNCAPTDHHEAGAGVDARGETVALLRFRAVLQQPDVAKLGRL